MNLKTYSRDGRLPIEKLYRSYFKLKEKFGWILEKIYDQRVEGVSFPILGFCTPKQGEAIWLLAGIHGEEPAGPIALAQNIEFLGRLGEKGIPIVLLPLCNPKGYLLDWRYPNEKRDEKKGKSVGDSRHLLPDLKNSQKPRLEKPICEEAGALTSWVVKTAKKYPPLLAIDFHEDEDKSGKDPYIFFNGEKGAEDPVAREVVKILLENGFNLQKSGKTKEGERIVNGTVSNLSDSSIDELLSAKRIILEGKQALGPSAEKVVVVETRTIGVPLEKRVKVHGEILRSLLYPH